jgi:hypothetical protein
MPILVASDPAPELDRPDPDPTKKARIRISNTIVLIHYRGNWESAPALY